MDTTRRPGPKQFGTATVQEREIVELVRSLRVAGEGPVSIAQTLNECGYRTRRGTPWSTQRVSQIIHLQVPSREIILTARRCRAGLSSSLKQLQRLGVVGEDVVTRERSGTLTLAEADNALSAVA